MSKSSHPDQPSTSAISHTTTSASTQAKKRGFWKSLFGSQQHDPAQALATTDHPTQGTDLAYTQAPANTKLLDLAHNQSFPAVSPIVAEAPAVPDQVQATNDLLDSDNFFQQVAKIDALTTPDITTSESELLGESIAINDLSLDHELSPASTRATVASSREHGVTTARTTSKRHFAFSTPEEPELHGLPSFNDLIKTSLHQRVIDPASSTTTPTSLVTSTTPFGAVPTGVSSVAPELTKDDAFPRFGEVGSNLALAAQANKTNASSQRSFNKFSTHATKVVVPATKQAITSSSVTSEDLSVTTAQTPEANTQLTAGATSITTTSEPTTNSVAATAAVPSFSFKTKATVATTANTTTADSATTTTASNATITANHSLTTPSETGVASSTATTSSNNVTVTTNAKLSPETLASTQAVEKAEPTSVLELDLEHHDPEIETVVNLETKLQTLQVQELEALIPDILDEVESDTDAILADPDMVMSEEELQFMRTQAQQYRLPQLEVTPLSSSTELTQRTDNLAYREHSVLDDLDGSEVIDTTPASDIDPVSALQAYTNSLITKVTALPEATTADTGTSALLKPTLMASGLGAALAFTTAGKASQDQQSIDGLIAAGLAVDPAIAAQLQHQDASDEAHEPAVVAEHNVPATSNHDLTLDNSSLAANPLANFKAELQLEDENGELLSDDDYEIEVRHAYGQLIPIDSLGGKGVDQSNIAAPLATAVAGAVASTELATAHTSDKEQYTSYEQEDFRKDSYINRKITPMTPRFVANEEQEFASTIIGKDKNLFIVKIPTKTAQDLSIHVPQANDFSEDALPSYQDLERYIGPNAFGSIATGKQAISGIIPPPMPFNTPANNLLEEINKPSDPTYHRTHESGLSYRQEVLRQHLAGKHLELIPEYFSNPLSRFLWSVQEEYLDYPDYIDPLTRLELRHQREDFDEDGFKGTSPYLIAPPQFSDAEINYHLSVSEFIEEHDPSILDAPLVVTTEAEHLAQQQQTTAVPVPLPAVTPSEASTTSHDSLLDTLEHTRQGMYGSAKIVVGEQDEATTTTADTTAITATTNTSNAKPKVSTPSTAKPVPIPLPGFAPAPSAVTDEVATTQASTATQQTPAVTTEVDTTAIPIQEASVSARETTTKVVPKLIPLPALSFLNPQATTSEASETAEPQEAVATPSIADQHTSLGADAGLITVQATNTLASDATATAVAETRAMLTAEQTINPAPYQADYQALQARELRDEALTKAELAQMFTAPVVTTAPIELAATVGTVTPVAIDLTSGLAQREYQDQLQEEYDLGLGYAGNMPTLAVALTEAPTPEQVRIVVPGEARTTTEVTTANTVTVLPVTDGLAQAEQASFVQEVASLQAMPAPTEAQVTIAPPTGLADVSGINSIADVVALTETTVDASYPDPTQASIAPVKVRPFALFAHRDVNTTSTSEQSVSSAVRTTKAEVLPGLLNTTDTLATMPTRVVLGSVTETVTPTAAPVTAQVSSTNPSSFSATAELTSVPDISSIFTIDPTFAQQFGYKPPVSDTPATAKEAISPALEPDSAAEVAVDVTQANVSQVSATSSHLAAATSSKPLGRDYPAEVVSLDQLEKLDHIDNVLVISKEQHHTIAGHEQSPSLAPEVTAVTVPAELAMSSPVSISNTVTPVPVVTSEATEVAPTPVLTNPVSSEATEEVFTFLPEATGMASFVMLDEEDAGTRDTADTANSTTHVAHTSTNTTTNHTPTNETDSSEELEVGFGAMNVPTVDLFGISLVDQPEFTTRKKP